MQAGILAGYQVVDVSVELYDGSYHEVDSSEMAFKIAGSIAFKEAMRQAQPVLMEPIMKVSVIVPDEYVGTVIGVVARFRVRKPEPVPYRLMLWCRCPKCSVIPTTCVRTLRVVVSTPWNRIATRKYRRILLKRLWLPERSNARFLKIRRNFCIFLKKDLHFSWKSGTIVLSHITA